MDYWITGDPSDPISCELCDWSGLRIDTRAEYINSPFDVWAALAGREGWEWHCPECGHIVDRYYLRMS